MSVEPILEINNLTLDVVKPKGLQNVFEHFNLKIDRKTIVGLSGRSGIGKSSIAKGILGLIDQDRLKLSGEILFKYSNLSINLLDTTNWVDIRGQKISMIFQESMTHMDPTKKCGRQLLDRLLEVNQKATLKMTYPLIEAVGLIDSTDIANRYPFELSGGQAQRLQIAMALCTKPRLLICDEITASLDIESKKNILNLLKSIKDDNDLSILFISHDKESLEYLCDKIVTMEHALPLSHLSMPKELTPRTNYPLELKNISFGYRQKVILEDVSYIFSSHKIYGLKGISGEGKTTLGKIMAHLIQLKDGKVILDDQIINDAKHISKTSKVIYLYQEAHLAFDPKRKIWGQLIEIYLNTGQAKKKFITFISQLCAQLSIDVEQLNKYPFAYSGGQKQRLNLMRVLCAQPQYIVCDEIFSALDAQTKNEIRQVLLDINKKNGVGIILISHDTDCFKNLVDHVLELKSRKLLEIS